MLFHVSVEADNPREVAEVIALFWRGEALPFPQIGEGSWVALSGDAFGSMIEVYPRGTELHEGDDGAVGNMSAQRRHGATHFAMGTTLNAGEVLAIAHRHGWTARYCRRGDRFGLIEIWIEGCMMVEVLTEEMQQEYLDTITIDNWKQMLRDMPIADAA